VLLAANERVVTKANYVQACDRNAQPYSIIIIVIIIIIIQDSKKDCKKCKLFLMKCALEREETKKECLEVLIVERRENSASGSERFRVTRRTAKCFCDVEKRLDARQHRDSSR
jgi:hypothetical protein